MKNTFCSLARKNGNLSCWITVVFPLLLLTCCNVSAGTQPFYSEPVFTKNGQEDRSWKQDAEEKGRGGEKPGTRNPKPETNNPKPVMSEAEPSAIQNLSSTKIGDPNSKITSIPQSTILEDYGKLPLYFIRNDGQMDKRVKYYEKGNGHTMLFTEKGVYLSLVSPTFAIRGVNKPLSQ